MNSNKKNILFILHLPPPVHGAAMVGKYIKDSELINSEFDCHYINLAIASSLEDIGKVGIKKLWHFLLLLRTIRNEVKRVKPDLVYITPNAKGGAFYKEWVIVMMLKMMGCRIVAHYHNKGVSSRQDKLLDNWMYRRFFKNIKVILLAEALYPDIQKYVRREDVYICPNGIPFKEHKYQERDNTIPHLLFLSNLLLSKGVLVLLDSLKILQDKGSSFVCDFVGGETKEIDKNILAKEIARRHLNKLVIYHGKKYDDDKDEMFENADIFIFPTFYDNETFGLVNLEAMAHHIPVISTNEGGIPSVVRDGENGLICERKDPYSLANCIQKLLENPELRNRMGADGYQKLKKYFTKDVFEKNMKNILLSEVGGD